MLFIIHCIIHSRIDYLSSMWYSELLYIFTSSCQSLDEERVHIRKQCATLGTAESWTPLDLKDDKAQLAGMDHRMWGYPQL